MPPSRAESVAPFRARAHAPARARALCTSPLLRFVSCPLSLPPPILRLTHGITRCTYLYLALCLFLFPCRISPLLSYSLPLPLSFPLCFPVLRFPSSLSLWPLFARGSRYTHLPLPGHPLSHPKERSTPHHGGTVARSGRWPRDHVVCISHTLLTYICIGSHLDVCTRAPMHMHVGQPAEPRTRSFRGK